MTGLLDTEERDQLLTGNYQIRQVYELWIQQNEYGWGTPYQNIIHNDNDEITVVDYGTLAREAFNQTMDNPGKLVPGLFKFKVSNSDGSFSVGGDQWKNQVSSYQAQPTECRFIHFIMIWADGMWRPLESVGWKGKVKSVDYEHKGFKPTFATITVENEWALKLTGKVWDEDDYDSLEIKNSSAATITFTGPIQGEN